MHAATDARGRVHAVKNEDPVAIAASQQVYDHAFPPDGPAPVSPAAGPAPAEAVALERHVAL